MDRPLRKRQRHLGLIFLRFAEVRFATLRAKLEAAGASIRSGSRVDKPTAYRADISPRPVNISKMAFEQTKACRH